MVAIVRASSRGAPRFVHERQSAIGPAATALQCVLDATGQVRRKLPLFAGAVLGKSIVRPFYGSSRDDGDIRCVVTDRRHPGMVVVNFGQARIDLARVSGWGGRGTDKISGFFRQASRYVPLDVLGGRATGSFASLSHSFSNLKSSRQPHCFTVQFPHHPSLCLQSLLFQLNTSIILR